MFNFHIVNSLLQYYKTPSGEGTAEFFRVGGDRLGFLRYYKFDIRKISNSEICELRKSLIKIRRQYRDEIRDAKATERQTCYSISEMRDDSF